MKKLQLKRNENAFWVCVNMKIDNYNGIGKWTTFDNKNNDFNYKVLFLECDVFNFIYELKQKKKNINGIREVEH